MTYEQKIKLKELRCKAWGITEDEYYCKWCGDFELDDMYKAYRRGKNEGARMYEVSLRDKIFLGELLKEQTEITKKLDDQLTKAKELLERLLITSCNSDVLNLLPNCSEVLRVRVEAEQFLSEVEK